MIYAGLTPPDRAEKRLLADLNLQVGIPIVAVRYYRELAATETDTVITTRLAHALRSLNRRTEALQAIESHLKKKSAGDLLWLKAELLYEMKQYKRAAVAYRLCAQKSPRAGRAWLMAGYALWQAGNIPAARKELTRATAYPKQAKSARAALGNLKTASQDTRVDNGPGGTFASDTSHAFNTPAASLDRPDSRLDRPDACAAG